MVTTVPVTPTLVTELVLALAGHVVAALVLLHHEVALLASLEVEIVSQDGGDRTVTLGVLLVGGVQAHPAVLLGTLCAEYEVVVGDHGGQLGELAVRADPEGGVAERLKIYEDFLISLFQVFGQ